MKNLRCLIVDDERLARDALRDLLAEVSGVEVVGEADRVKSAVAAVGSLAPDVLLLDVSMPGGGGFEVLRALSAPPAVIFVTAYDRYALRAFEVNAVDYLLKPVEPERLAEALHRVHARAHEGRPPPRGNTLQLQQDDVVLLELGESGHFRKVNDLLAVQADGKYSVAYCTDGQRYMVRRSMIEWEQRLPSDLFVRLDRGLLVNRAQIRSADFHQRSATVQLAELRHPFQLGRSAAARLRDLLKEE